MRALIGLDEADHPRRERHDHRRCLPRGGAGEDRTVALEERTVVADDPRPDATEVDRDHGQSGEQQAGSVSRTRSLSREPWTPNAAPTAMTLHKIAFT